MVDTSVVIPVHNAEKTLRRCVESIVFGTAKEIEVILVEDHSTDKSWDECIKLNNEYQCVKCVQNVMKRGVSSTRNIGIEFSSGTFVVFVDSDDWVSGKYIELLVKNANKDLRALAVSGYTFIDNVNAERKYFLHDCTSEISTLPISNSFDLQEKILLQQLWNKAFYREYIEQFHLRFDEVQTMGEDFQFVLDYLEAAKIERYIIINSPLYYYVRANNSSLMSMFGIMENDTALHRLEMLYNVCGREGEVVKDQYAKSIGALKRNCIYQICHATSMEKKEKLALIEHLMKDGRANTYYNEQQKLKRKEALACRLNQYKKLPQRVCGKLQRVKRNLAADAARTQLVHKEFSIISQNCIGGVFYHDMGLQFLTPTVNLFFKASDFVRFANNLEYYINQNLQMEWGEEYPVGRLDDISVNFMHYSSCSEALEAWERRKKRICWNKILILATDMEGFDDSCYCEWEKIQYPKILFTVKKRKAENSVWFKEYQDRDCVPDLIPKREFYKEGSLIRLINRLSESK